MIVAAAGAGLAARARPWLGRAASLAPGMLLCLVIAAAARGVQGLELRWLRHAWLEPVALSILLGVAVRLPGRWRTACRPGIVFSARTVLEIAVVLLGASVSLALLGAAGPLLLLGVAATVGLSLAGSYLLGRLLGLSRNQATLVACANSICGNSAIAAVAPVIGADADDVAASITFTAVLSIVVVVGLPLLAPLLHLTPMAYGVLAGLTVYAVPQVVAATAPLGAVAMQAGALVKLTRVLMLGPAIAGVAALSRAYPGVAADLFREPAAGRRSRLPVPWFVIGFAALLALRASGMLGEGSAQGAARLSLWLTGLSMAALGLMVDIRTVFRAGSRMSAAAILSILLLGGIGCLLLRLLGLA